MPVQDDDEAKASIEGLAIILADGSNEFECVEQSRALAGCHLDLRRIRAARYDVFLTMNDLEKASGFDFANALRAMDKISRYEKRALSRRKRALRGDFTSEEK